MSAINAMSAAQRTELNESLDYIKTCDYKGTHVKVELEAQLDRPGHDEDEYCGYCDGDGYNLCSYCDDGEVPHDHDEDCQELGCSLDYDNCSDCEGSYRSDCDECGGSGRQGDGDWSVEACEEFILEHVPASAKSALTYCRFYNDGSVDSEFTFTLPINLAHYVVYFIEAFKALADEIGNGLETDGAGMHIAILNNPEGRYPDGNELDQTKSSNFARSITPLLPALYFLASATYKSRGLQYRPPSIELHDKYGAISGSHHVFEYRIFETCYERPLAFIDFMIVIAKTLHYYRDDYRDTSLKLGRLGIKDGHGIERFYYTSKHLDALDKGLKLLKPDYKTIDQLKTERNFKIDEAKLKQQEKQRLQEWHDEFASVKQRRRYERMKLYHKGIAAAYERLANGSTDKVNVTKFARQYVEDYQQNYGYSLKGNVRQYLTMKSEQYLTQDVRYSVTV